ncbi:MAG: molybdopterin-guanine dinucleotide biosynthesis protein B [Candidatus Bipolaricaulota bacterium]
MIKPPVVAIYGASDSGKTELVVNLVNDFVEEGLEICTVKHSPGELSLDEEGKDTWRHRQAGSRLTVLATEVETAFLFPEKMKLEGIGDIVDGFGDYDLVIAEGYKDAEVPKIAVGEIDPRCCTLRVYDGNLAALKEEIRGLLEVKEIEAELPGLDCGRCGYDSCNGLSRAIYDGEKDLSHCEVREQHTVNLEVNGERVPLENFPASFVEGGLKGMLGALKGVDEEIDRISLEIRDDS